MNCLCEEIQKILLSLIYTFIPIDYNDSHADVSFVSDFVSG
jgi:hypothetical protein